MSGDDGDMGGGGQEDMVGASAAKTSETTAAKLDSMGYTSGGGGPDGDGADSGPGSPTPLAVKVFALVVTAFLLVLFVLGSGLF